MEALILHKAEELFFAYGLKTITMDDIAKTAGVSKKTIYQHFTSKDDMLDCVIRKLLQCHREGLEQCQAVSANAVEEVVMTARLTLRNIALVNNNFFYDLEKFYPAMWQLAEEHRNKVVLPSIVNNLHKGMADEHYRQDLDPDFVAQVRIQQIMTAFNPKLFNGKIHSGNKLMMQLSAFYLHGVTSPKGALLINNYLNVNNEQQFSI